MTENRKISKNPPKNMFSHANAIIHLLIRPAPDAISICLILQTSAYGINRPTNFKGGLQWKNDLDLYSSLVLLMNIGMGDLVILRLVKLLQEF